MTDKSERTVNMGERPANTMKIDKPKEITFHMQWRMDDADYTGIVAEIVKIDFVMEVNTFEPHGNGINVKYTTQTNANSMAILVAIMETQTAAPGLKLIGIDFDEE